MRPNTKLTFEALGELQLFRRSVDAPQRCHWLMYSVDVSVADEATVLGKLPRIAGDALRSSIVRSPFEAMSVNSDSHELLEGGKHGHRDQSQ